MKIVLVLLNEFIAKHRNQKSRLIGKKGAYAPTTLITLASLVPEELNAEIEIIDEFIELFNPETIEADLVGISFTTPNAFHAYRLSAILRKRLITVVFGGFHTTALPEEASLHADACVLGYAEKSWQTLLFDFKNGNLKKIYKDSYHLEFNNLKVNKANLLKHKKYYYPYTVEFSRSCLNSCNFCVLAQFCGTEMQFRKIENLCSDIQQSKGKMIIFIDNHPTQNLEEFKQLCFALKKLKVNWYSSVTFKISKNYDLIRLMYESGCRGIFMGFESVNQESLDAEGKGFNQVNEYGEFIKLIHSYKMLVFASFVFGFDSDDKMVFKRTVEFIDKYNIDLVHYAILTPFPGTALFNTLESQNRILTKDWSRYDSLHVNFEPVKMSAAELQEGFRWAYLKTHNLKSILKRSIFSPARSFTIVSGNIGLGIYGRKILNEIV